MINNVQNVKPGDDVFRFSNHTEHPTVRKVTRATNNFVFIESWNKSEIKFRRDGSGMDRFHGRLATIEPGDVEKFEKQKADEKRIGEIITFLNSKRFKFNGYTTWYSIEQWEKIAAALKD